jgi:integrase
MKNQRDGIYARTDRKGYWISWTDAQGKRRRRKTDAETKHQARRALSAELVKVEQAKTLGFTPPGKDSFAEIAERFLAYQKARLTAKAYERESGIVENHLKSFFKGELASIRRQNIQKYITARSAKVSAYSVQKESNILKHLLRLAVDWEIIPYYPADKVKSPKVPDGRVRYLQPEELRLVTAACPDWLQPIVILAVNTGMRRSELLKLRWLDYDEANNRLSLLRTKNGSDRIVYLNQAARAVLESLERTKSKIFPGISPGRVTVTFKRVCKRIGIEDFRYHDLRHTAASHLRMAGEDIHTVATVLGHKDLRQAMRYQHLSPDYLTNAVNRLDGVFGHQSVTRETLVLTDESVTH